MPRVEMRINDEGYEWLEDGTEGRELGLDFAGPDVEVSVEVRGQGPTMSRLLNEAGFQADEAVYIISAHEAGFRPGETVHVIPASEDRSDAWALLLQAIELARAKGQHLSIYSPDNIVHPGQFIVGRGAGSPHRAQRLEDALAAFVRANTEGREG